MANLRRHGDGPYHLELRFAGKKFQRSLRTKNKSDADRMRALVEQTVDFVDRGIVELPCNATANDIWKFLVSGGKVRPKVKPTEPNAPSFSSAGEAYLNSFVEGAKEESTLKTERQHLAHLERLLGRDLKINCVTCSNLEGYVQKRRKEKGIRGRNVSAATVSKELSTFGLIWKFARGRKWVSGENPAASIPKPRSNQKPPFMTYEEIETRVNRGGLTDAEVADLWDSLFLRENEIGAILAHIKENASRFPHAPYLFPAIAFCAYTGARRSEMFRARIDDINGRVVLWEKKRSRERRLTFREIPLHNELEVVLREWLVNHPGGKFLFCKRSGKELDDKTSRDALNAVLRNSKWSVLRGYHVFRHSFASNLARHGTDQRIIDSWMGHQTEEMRQRYRHLFPEDAAKALAVLSFPPTRGNE